MAKSPLDPERHYKVLGGGHHIVIVPTVKVLTDIDLADPRLSEPALRDVRFIILDLTGGRMVNHDPLVQLNQLWERHTQARNRNGDVRIVTDHVSTIRMMVGVLSFEHRLVIYETMADAKREV